METEYYLQPNSQIALIKKKDEKIGIYLKEDLIDINNPLHEIKANNGYIEELPATKSNRLKLIVFFPKKMEGHTYYTINLLDINTEYQSCRKTEFIAKEKPIKLANNMYLLFGFKNDICILNKDGMLFELEKYIRSCLKDKTVSIQNISLNHFDIKKNPDIYELMIELENIETMHIYLKLKDKVEIYNTFYSEMADSRAFTFLDDKAPNDFISTNNFYERLKEHPIIKEVEYIKYYQETEQKKQRNKIRAKVWPTIPRRDH